MMNRGLGRRNIFRSDEDRDFFLWLLGETSEIYKIEVHAYSLLDNHYHLLVHLPQVGLSRAMRHLNGVFTQKVNKRWKSDGPIFRGRYKAVLVDSEEYLLELARYIHLNPVEAGVCSKPQAHPWTSHIAYLKKSVRPSWLVTKEVLGHFGRGENRAIKEFDIFVQEGVSRKFRDQMGKKRIILGSKGFCEWVYENFVEREKQGIPLQERKPKHKVSIREVLEQVSHAYNMPTASLRSAKAGRGKKNEARSMAIYLIRHLSGAPQKRIAKWIRANNQNAVAQLHYRFKQELKRNKELKKLTNIISHSIQS